MMKLSGTFFAAFLLAGITEQTLGLCQNEVESSVCSTCRQSPWGPSIAQDCCFHKTAFLLCEACVKSVSACQALMKEYEQPELDKRETDPEDPEWVYQFPPQRRAKFFLGRRDADDSENDMSMHKKSRVFLGKRFSFADSRWSNAMDAGASWNVQSDLEDPAENKRGRAFLGKRDVSKRSEEEATSLDLIRPYYDRPLTRRAKYFLGKRSGNEE